MMQKTPLFKAKTLRLVILGLALSALILVLAVLLEPESGVPTDEVGGAGAGSMQVR